MSLFKARDWWAVSIGSEEIFGHSNLCVANIDNAPSQLDKVIVGSYQGIVRIYSPQSGKAESLKAEDVFLEQQLQHPILQLEVGKFVSVSDALHLAVLHPRKLAVYSVSGSSASVEHGSQYQLKLVYEHNLQRSAYNMVVGPFGSVKGKDFLCVQSLDGTVSFFEQESFAFSRFLPNFLLPGPITYIPRTDSFVTVSSSWQVESYKYQVLAVAHDADSKEESQRVVVGKKISVDWTFNLGEPVIDVTVAPVNNASPVILILGERSVVCLKDNGTLKFMKKLEYNPCCFYPHTSMAEDTVMYLAATNTGQMMVYGGVTLKWAAKLEYAPVSIRVGQYQDLKGVITTLDADGHLTCSYLGTDPSLLVVPTPESREINYDEQDEEMKRLQQVIRESSHSADVLPKKVSEEELQIQAHVPPNLDRTSVYDYFLTTDCIQVSTEDGVKDEDPIPSITVKITLSSRSGLQNVRLLIDSPFPVTANQGTFTIPYVGDSNNPSQILVSFFMRGNSLPSKTVARATATYHLPSGPPRIAQCDIKLPLKLVCKPAGPVKNATFKLTLDTNRNCVNLNDIFPDFITSDGSGSSNAMGFQIFGGPVVTLLSSKSSQRYRLQCDVFEAMWPVMKEFLDRVVKYQLQSGAKDFQCSFSSNLPLQEYFDLIEMHLELRRHAERYKDLLDQRAKQFRAIQRRLLTRFKDKTPAPLANLDTLLDGTYRQILKLAEGVEENQAALVRCSMGLGCATHIINTLLKLQFNLTDKEMEVLEASLTPEVYCDGEQGWEETVDAAISNLLRTCLAKTAKDQTINPTAFEMPPDSSKLKKHIMQLTDRLTKGGRLFIEGQEPGQRTVKATQAVARPPSGVSRDFSTDDTRSSGNA
ncbi:Protein PTHB1 [Holothuria leucospilota]|uniref:Protein PTHB1 n=1 Tax=Holothuria leucospilota TaxID=206669 RepID=A0A9Q1BCB7_HOLLE|nr:Protein PTHB1 [Holothuria leucospilota]